jgi:hypothetical protein
MKGASNVQTNPMDFEKILVSDFADRAWPLGKDQALGCIDSQDPQEPLAQDSI